MNLKYEKQSLYHKPEEGLNEPDTLLLSSNSCKVGYETKRNQNNHNMYKITNMWPVT